MRLFLRSFNISIFIFLFLTLLNHKSINAQWTRTNGPNGANIKAIIFQDNYIFAGSNNGFAYGVYVSTDNGAAWTKSPEDMNRGSFYSFTTLGNITFASFSQGIFKYNSSSGLWERISLIPIPYMTTCGNKLYGVSGAVCVSADSGLTWTAVTDGFPADIILKAICSDGKNIFVATNKGVYISTDGGQKYTASNTGLSYLDINCITAVQGNVYIGTNDGKVYRSDNTASAWELRDNGLSGSSIISIAASGNNVYAGCNYTGGGLYISSDNGKNWEPAWNPFYYPDKISLQIYSIAVSGSKVAIGTDNGMYLSEDNGLTWKGINAGVGNGSVKSLVAIGNSIIAGTDGHGYGPDICMTKDTGNSWSVISTLPTSSNYIRAMVNDGSSLFTACDLAFYYSTDAGSSWNKAELPAISTSLLLNNGSLFAGTYAGKIYYSGLKPFDLKLLSEVASTGQVTSLAASQNNLIAGINSMETGGIYISSDMGATWKLVDLTKTGKNVFSLLSFGQYVFAGTGWGIFVSTDNGNSWTAAEGLSKSVTALATDGKNLYAGTTSGLYSLQGTGNNWKVIKSGIESDKISSLLVSGKILYAGTKNGIWRCPVSDLSTSSVTEGANGMPRSFSLGQNYPNPFNPSTIISYSIPSDDQVKLVIYDMLGKEVVTLLNEFKSAGSHEVQFNASSLPSGIYIYTIQAGQYRASKKLMILK